MSNSFEDFCGGPFWNETLLLDNWWPELTSCFRVLVLIVGPSGILLVATLFYIPILANKSDIKLPLSRLYLTKTFTSAVLALISFVNIFMTVSDENHGKDIPRVYIVGHSMELIAYILTMVIMHVERQRGVFTSGLLFVYWTIVTCCYTVPFYTYIILEVYRDSMLYFTLFYISFGLIVLQFILQWFSDVPRKQQGYQVFGERPCPEVTASFPSRLVYGWMTKLVVTGYRKGIEEDDLWDLNPRDSSDTLFPPFELAWADEKARIAEKNSSFKHNENVIYNNGVIHLSKSENETTPLVSSSQYKQKASFNGSLTASSLGYYSSSYKSQREEHVDPRRGLRKPSLMRVLTKLYGAQLALLFFVKLIADVLQLMGPIVMSALINFISSKEPNREWEGYVLASMLLVLSLARSVFYQASLNQAAILGLQMKTTIIAAIYKKSLTLNNEAKKTTTTGEIVNLMSVDCQRINDVMNYLFLLWSVPIQIILSIVLLYNTIGVSIFSGLAVLLVMIPFNGYLANRQRKLQQQNLKQKDERIKLLNEILNGIKVLKLYAWEDSFKRKVEEIREREIGSLDKIAHLNVILGLGWTVAPFLVILATFATYVLIDPLNTLDANKAFVTLSLFNILRVPMNLLSSIMSFTVQAYVSIKRVNTFLCTEDLDEGSVTFDKNADDAIRIERGTFTWDRDTAPNLRDINLIVPRGQLVAVVGNVGCGKSSLVSAILGEMEKLNGTVTVNSSIAYVPQQAWIQNATLRDNVLFGKKWREKKYKTVIEACALEPDFSILEAGDQTEIGEKGINLSGGQKQRVSLARAVYSNSDIYLFDDPLSAVDSHVGKHIFSKVIGAGGLLKDKTRILVTHGVHWLPMVDTIVVLNDGVITETGSYEELLSCEGHFSEFLKTYLIEQNDDEEDDDLEIRLIKEKMLDRLESMTSDATSDDNSTRKLRKRSLKTKTQPEAKDTLKRFKGKLIQIETMETGKVRWSVFWMYCRSAGVTSFPLSVLVFFAYQAINSWASFYLTDWTDDPFLNNASSLSEQEFITRNETYLGLYSSFGLGMIATVWISGYLFWTRMVRAARRLHGAILKRVFLSPMSFFETTPLGRILNRLSRDVETIDNTLPSIVRMFISTFSNVLATLLIICINTPLFITVMVPLMILYYFIQKFYIPTSRQLKRIESVTRSPVYTHFSESITGASSIRAYKAQDRFIDESKRKVDRNQVFYFSGIVSNRWLAFYLDMIGTLIVFASGLFAIVTPGVSGGTLGLSVSYALQISGTMGWMVRQISDLETNIVSVERVKEYSELPSEAAAILPDNRPPPGWPQCGHVELRNYMTRYREGLDLVLKGLTCTIQGGQRVGIVGRTGAGKSSFTLALFRILEAAGGSIVVDGINIAEIGLHDVRSRLTILPQDPVLFSGTLRMNLDPFDEFSDEVIWQALERAYLKRFAMETPSQLMYQCGEGGENLSVGQRQLVCLARALLRHTKVLVLDEATAAVDMETDSLIQKTIREAFTDCTIITIAHRLNTIMDYDKVIVMDAGQIKEFDKPDTLLENRNSIFYGMARNAGLV